MTRTMTFMVAMGLSVMAGATPALAGQQIYIYSIVHPTYGNIGTLTQTIERSPEKIRIDSHLRIAVTLLGVVVYRQESDATEIMRGNRLVSLLCVTEQGHRHVEVHGEAQGDRFVVNATAGSFAGSAAIIPADPWFVNHTGDETVVFPDTGRISNILISGGDYGTVSVNGAAVSARHFVLTGDKRQEVWLDDRAIPVMSRTIENGTPIDFVLQRATAGADPTMVASLQLSAPAPPKSGNE